MAGEMISTLISMAFLTPIFLVAIMFVLKWTLMGEVDMAGGFLTLLFLFGTYFLALVSRNDQLQLVTTVGMISLMVMFKFAANHLDRHDLREINAEHIDRAILELSIRPDNYPAWFKLADSLYNAGYHGHAIALAEETINRIPSQPDPLQNRSLRDMFRSEELLIKKWRAESTNPKRHQPIPCPKCRAMNRPGTINCIKCGVPYLLLLSRGVGTKAGVYSKLLIGWAIIAFLIPAAGFLANNVGGGMGIFAAVGAVTLAGGVLYWIFRDPSGQPDSFRSFS